MPVVQRLTLTYQLEPHWPALAWIARHTVGDPSVVVRHGVGVETHEQWFGEIIWDGAYQDGGFDESDLVYGSGGRCRDGGVLFAASATTMDRLQHHADTDGWRVSNSLVCLAEDLDATFDPWCSKYPRAFSAIIRGFDRYHADASLSVLQSSRGPITLTYHDNLMASDAQVRRESKPVARRTFDSYASYREFLESSLSRLTTNLSDARRNFPLGWLGTISTGFDSPTVAALARHVGLQEVVTIPTARDGHNDDGEPIATCLGLHTIKCPRDAWQSEPLTVACFLAADAKGEDVHLAAAREKLHGRVLLTGYNAAPWRLMNEPNPDLERTDQAGLSLTEFRLQAGFIHLPLPTMGVAGSPNLHEMNHRAEMAPWSTGAKYNKPFCRRVLDESGVPAELYGQEKKAASVLMFDRRTFLSRESFEHYSEYLSRNRRQHPLRSGVDNLRNALIRLSSSAAGALRWVAQQGYRLSGLSMLGRVANSTRLKEIAYREPRFDRLFPWAIEIAKRAYHNRDNDDLACDQQQYASEARDASSKASSP